MDVRLRLQPILTNVIYMIGTLLGLNCLAVGLFLTMWRFTRFIVRRRVDCFIQMINSWISNYLQSQYSIFADPKLMSTFRNGAFQTKTRPYVHRASSPLDQRSLTFTFDKIQDSRFKSSYSTIYRHQSYKSTEQCEKTNQIFLDEYMSGDPR